MDEIVGISYKTREGELFTRRKPEFFAAHALAHDVQSIRLPTSYKGQRHLPGYFWMSKLNTLVGYESRLEMTILLQLDFNPNIVYAVSQPFELHYVVEKKFYRHTPDFLVQYKDGTTEVINVKPKKFLYKEDNVIDFRACEAVAVEMGWAYTTRSELHAILLANLKWLAGYRRTPIGLSDYAPQIIDATTDALPFDELISWMKGATPLLLPIVFHLIWCGVLQVDLYARLCGSTLVQLPTSASKS